MQMEFVRMSAKQYRDMISGKGNKYHAEKAVVNGIEYDSRKEARRGMELQALERAGKINNLEMQKRFILQEGFVYGREKIRSISYLADFYYEKDGKKYVEDTKGFRTEVYKIKRKMFLYRYPDIIFIEK